MRAVEIAVVGEHVAYAARHVAADHHAPVAMFRTAMPDDDVFGGPVQRRPSSFMPDFKMMQSSNVSSVQCSTRTFFEELMLMPSLFGP